MAEKNDAAAEHGMSGLAIKIAEKANRSKYLILAAVVVLVAAMAIVSYQRRQQAAREANAETTIFQAEIDLASKPESDGVAIFGKAAKDFEGLPAGARSLVAQFAYAFNTRNFAAAEQSARDFIRVYPKNILADRARLALAGALAMQSKTGEAATALRELIGRANPEVFPEAKLALAQALEREAEAVKDNPEEYRRRLEAAEGEYNDIVVRSQISVPSQRGFWPPAVILAADYSLVVLRDRLAGHTHAAPRGGAEPSLTPPAETGILSTPPPPPPADKPAPAAEAKAEGEGAAKENAK